MLHPSDLARLFVVGHPSVCPTQTKLLVTTTLQLYSVLCKESTNLGYVNKIFLRQSWLLVGLADFKIYEITNK